MSGSDTRLAEAALALDAEAFRRSAARSLTAAGVGLLRVRDDAFLMDAEANVERILSGADWIADQAFGAGAFVHPRGGVTFFSRTLSMPGSARRTGNRVIRALWADAVESGHGWLVPGPAGSARLDAIGVGHTDEGRFAESIRLKREGFGFNGSPKRRITFFGNTLQVPRGVYDPKPVTEAVVRVSLEKLHGVSSPNVVDVGTGSGAIAVSIAKARPDSVVFAVDTSARAVSAARKNARKLRVLVRVIRGNLLDPIEPNIPLDVICANVPYVAPWLYGDPAYEAPRSCVAGGDPDGLGLVREVVYRGRERLRPGGALVLQVANEQWDAVRALLDSEGYLPVDPAERKVGRAVVGSAIWLGADRPPTFWPGEFSEHR